MHTTNISHLQDIPSIRSLVLDLNERIRILENGANENIAKNLMNSGDIAWLLTATALVFFMTIPGLTLYYAGMATQKTNIMTIAMQSFTICCLITVDWMLFGYSLSFGSLVKNPVIGDYSRFFLVNFQSNQGHDLAPTIPEQLFCVYQLGFAVVTACILCGASADRMKFNSMITFIAIWHLLVYCPIAHANWNHSGFLYRVGVLDWAGGNVVHVAAGMSGLVTSMVIGKRRGYGEQPMTPNNMLQTIVGACFLWVGWFGFNGGSSFRADEGAARALFMTQIATSAASFSWILMERLTTKRPTVLGMLNGAIAGLVAVTPAAGYVDATGAFFIGLISGPVCYYGTNVKKKLGLDDALDAFGLHGIAGFYGILMTGLFADEDGATGAFYGNPFQLAIQLYGAVCTIAWSLCMTYCILIVINMTMGLRVSVTAEESGLDRSSHGEGLYAQRSKTTLTADQLDQLLESCTAATASARATVAAANAAAAAARAAESYGADPLIYHQPRVRFSDDQFINDTRESGVGVGNIEGNGAIRVVGGIECSERKDEFPYTAEEKSYFHQKYLADDGSDSTKNAVITIRRNV